MKMFLARSLLSLLCLVPMLPASADSGSSFIRIERNERKEPVALQTAITKYVPVSGVKGVEIDLVAVVHIGDKAYYERLNKEFVQYESVLYELVAAEGTRPQKGGEMRMDNPLSMLQQGMQLALRLEHQLQIVDYEKRNFVHADLSFEGIRKAIKDRGEDEMTVFFRVVQELLEKASADTKPGSQVPDLDVLLGILRDPSRLKKSMAEQLADAGGDAGFGKTMNQLLVVDRNKAALDVLRKQLTAGRKKIAIFYGAAHMPDFDKRLKEEFGMKPAETTWLNAWNL